MGQKNTGERAMKLPTDAIWRNWRSVHPPRFTVVIGRYEGRDEAIRCRTCKHGCCINAGMGAQLLPDWWTPTNDQDSPLEYHALPSTSSENAP